MEVCLRNTWGTVCDDRWGVQDSAVVCGQLGHSLTGALLVANMHALLIMFCLCYIEKQVIIYYTHCSL